MPKTYGEMVPNGMSSIFTVESLQKSLFPGLYAARQKGSYPNFRQRPLSDIVH